MLRNSRVMRLCRCGGQPAGGRQAAPSRSYQGTAICTTKARTPFLSERSICTRGPIHDYLIVGLHYKLLLKMKILPGDLSSIYYD
jgi:hypothetical protein